jgi:tetratricopeptide (TPR) repeat protein
MGISLGYSQKEFQMAAKKEKQDLEAEVWNAITAFEQILEAMPNDRASLEALSHAYEQIGDLTKAKEYFLRLGNVLMDEGDAAAGADLLERLRPFAADDEEAAELVSKIEAAGGGASAASATAPAVAEVGAESLTSETSPEIPGDAATAPKKKDSAGQHGLQYG